MLQKLYFKHGLHWPHRYVPIVQALILAVLVAGALAWAALLQMAVDDARRELLHEKAAAVTLLLECMNGKAVWTHPNGRKDGFRMRVHHCLGTEEFDV